MTKKPATDRAAGSVVRCKDPMVSREIDSRFRHERCQSSNEIYHFPDFLTPLTSLYEIPRLQIYDCDGEQFDRLMCDRLIDTWLLCPQTETNITRRVSAPKRGTPQDFACGLSSGTQSTQIKLQAEEATPGAKDTT